MSRMDPLGARSQFVEVHTLPTWDQHDEVDNQDNHGEADQKIKVENLTNVPLSPFPFREDINKKIILL